MEDPWTDVLRIALRDLPGVLRREDAWDIIGLPQDRRGFYDVQRLNDCMKTLGFEVKQRRFEGPSERGYVRGEKDLRIYISIEEGNQKKGTHQAPPLTDKEITKRKMF
jgi:hypothetical protein